MKGGTRPLGYTIIEVMIVLAVSGIMFVIAANFISEKQAKTAFAAGSNEFNTQVQSIITQVTDGQYSDIDFQCSTTGTDITISAAPSSGTQGKNSPCIFLGKFIHFSVAGEKNKYEVFSLAGKRTATNLTDAIPTPIMSPDVDLTVQQTIPQGLEVKNVSVAVTNPDGSTSNYSYVWGLGYVQSTGEISGDGYASGGQVVDLVFTTGVNSSNLDQTAAADRITKTLRKANSAVICVTDGTRYAQILLGDRLTKSDQLTAKLQVVNSC